MSTTEDYEEELAPILEDYARPFIRIGQFVAGVLVLSVVALFLHFIS